MQKENYTSDDGSMTENPGESIDSLKKELNRKEIIVADLRDELQKIQTDSQLRLQEEIAGRTNLEKQLQESQDLQTDLKNDLRAQETRAKKLNDINQEVERKLEEMTQELSVKEREIEDYLKQIAQLNEVMAQQQKEIDEIENTHLEIQTQLQQEIQRTEDRVGQISSDFSRESKSTLSRDQHIRTVMSETDIGKITLYLVDYFENPGKKALALETLASELKLAPIMVRTHLRELHALEVCQFNEVTKEIKLVQK